jgi:molybdopterin/thiamine biosynthesis adenylyltransferase
VEEISLDVSRIADGLRERATTKALTDGKTYSLISLDNIKESANHLGLSLRDIELVALRESLIPACYAQNIPELGVEGQLRLLESCVCVVGAGGIGGWVIDLLARSGVGRIIVVDGDRFDETNLNRQVLCTESTIGHYKAEVACERIQDLNSSIETVAITEYATPENLLDIIKSHRVQVIADCVDKGSTRVWMQDIAKDLHIPMVHGSMGGFVGRVMTIFPGDKGVKEFYHETDSAGQVDTGPQVGSPGVTACVVGALQAGEILKLLTGNGHILRNEMMVLDIWNAQAAAVPLWTTKLGKFVNKLKGQK